MIYLILAILSSALVSLTMRFSEKYTSKEANIGMLAVNYAMCLFLASYYTGFQNLTATGENYSFSVATGLFNGFLYLAGFVLLQYNIKKNGVVLPATFMRLGVLVPTVASILVFGEMPTILQMIGFVIALAAIIGINMDKGQTQAGFKLGLILLLFSGGTADMMSKVYQEMGNPALEEQFLLYTFVSALILSIILTILKKQRFGKKELLFGLLIGIPNYYSARFLLKAVGSIPAVVAYPTYSVATIITITTVGILVFKEKINRRQMAALAGILVALVFLNM